MSTPETKDSVLVHAYSEDPDISPLGCTCRCKPGGSVFVDNTMVVKMDLKSDCPDVVVVTKPKPHSKKG